MPGQNDQKFSLTTTFTPNGRPNLGAFMAVDADATSPDYGTIRVLRVTVHGAGPTTGAERAQRRRQDVAEFVSNLRGTDSDIEYGNLLTVPLDGGFLYVEPVYARGGSANYPLLKKVAVSYGGKTVFEDTLAGGAQRGVRTGRRRSRPPTEPPPPGDTTKPPATGDTALKKAIADAQKAYDDGQAALKKGDWTAYGKAQEDCRTRSSGRGRADAPARPSGASRAPPRERRQRR